MSGSIPKVSVVIPVYNGQAFVADAIQSALAQSHTNMEIIAVNDGSPDGSLEILKQFGDQITIVDQQNSGVASARNAGIEKSTGEYVAFLDQDDWWLPEKTQFQLDVFHVNKNIGLVHTAVNHIDAKTGANLPPLNPNSQPAEMVGNCFDQLILGNPIYNSSVLVRRDVLDKVGNCDITLAGNTIADYELWLRIAQQYSFGYSERAVTCYRMHSDQGIWDRRAMLEAELRVLLKLKTSDEWRASLETKQRLSNLYDGLAVAYFQHGELFEARANFLNAYQTHKTLKSLTRLVASGLPKSIINRLRS